MAFYRFRRSQREKVQIWTMVWVIIVLSGFRLFVEVQPHVDTFFAAYTEFPVAVLALNALFFWLVALLWIAYRRWRISILSEQELERVLKSISPDTLLVINRDRVINMCSGQVETMFGFTEDELVGQKTDMLYYDRRLHGEKGEIASRLEKVGFHVGYATGKRKNGKTFPLEVVTGMMPYQEGAVVLIRDVTERCRMEDALRQSEIRFEQFMRYFPGFAFIKDKEGRRIYLNHAHASERGWDIEACIGCKDENLYREDLARQYRESDVRVLSEGKAVRYITRTVEADGSTNSLLTVKFPLPVPGEKDANVMIAGLSLDISEQEAAERDRIKIEQQMQQAQKLESLGVLAGGIAHDFNNLIMGIVGHADLALMHDAGTPQVRSHIQSVIASCQRAADLANQLLAYSGKGRFVLAPTHLNEVLTDLKDLLKVSISKKATVRFDLSDALPLIECDVTQVRQVLMNLIVNASDALEDSSGIITVRTGCVSLAKDKSREWIRLSPGQEPLPSGDYVMVQVIDTGVGMSEANQLKIFDPFFTTKKTGHGLGLAAVMGIVRSHGGGISVESTLGKGTVFTVYFPVSDHVAPAKKVVKETKEAWQGSGTVVLADDEEMVREVAKVMLESLGFDVIETVDGRHALDIFHDRSSDICALILDVTMPELSGIEVCRSLRDEGVAVPILLTSGYNQSEDIDCFPENDGIYFLKKPYRLDSLRGAMREVLRGQKAS